MDIIAKMERDHIVGRGGAAFPTHLKWKRMADSENPAKFVICNAAEGEPGVRKDLHILKNHLDVVFEGIKIALDYLKTGSSYFFIKQNYLDQIQPNFDEQMAKYKQMGYDIRLFISPDRYIAGESNALMSAIEGRPKLQPVVRRPSSGLCGVNGCPTLVDNVETLYDIALSSRDQYRGTRFCTINGNVPNPGVYEVASDTSVLSILEQTGNVPDFDFFVQVGGSASGYIFNHRQIETQELVGCGSIDIIPANTSYRDLMINWFKFFSIESCGLCVPCYKGGPQIRDLVLGAKNDDEIPWAEILKLTYKAKKGSFCGLGVSFSFPVESLIQNVIFEGAENQTQAN